MDLATLTNLTEALTSFRKIAEDHQQTIKDHEKRIGLLETKLQVYAKNASGVDLNEIAEEVFGKEGV